MKLQDLDLSKCLYDPRKTTLLNDVKHIPEFNVEISYRPSRKGLLTYIVLMYDHQSPLWREVRSLPARKGVAMELAGFKTDKNGRFEKYIEMVLEGRQPPVNSMIIKYLSLLNSPKWSQLIAFENLYYMELAKVQAGKYGKTGDIIKSLDSLSSSIEKLTEEIVGGSGEAEPVLAAIYKEVTKGLDVSVEKVASHIMESGDVPEDWNPYSEKDKDGEITEKYEVDKLRYAGDH